MRRDILTVQEHKTFGSSFPELQDPYKPVAVQTGQLTVEECQALREKQEVYQTMPLSWNVPGIIGLATLEPLDTDKNSANYGRTLRDPVLVKVIEKLPEELMTDTPDFPAPRDGPKTRLA